MRGPLERRADPLVAARERAEELLPDALDRLITRRRERRKLAKRAARWARGETIRRNVGRWLAVYEAAIAAARAGRARS